MKKKLFVALIAVVVISAIVGTCFAAYAKNAAPRNVSLSTGDAVVLGIDTDSVALAIADLQPGDGETYDVELTATNVAKAEAGIQGKFTVVIEADDDTKPADVALATYLDVKVGTTYDKAALTGGQLIALSSTPVALTLTFSIAEANFAAAAEGNVNVTLKWEIVDNWTASHEAYYVVGTMTGWQITKDCLTLSTDPAIIGGNTAVLKNVAFSAGDEFKIVHWNTTNSEWDWFSLQSGDGSYVGEGKPFSIGTGDSLGNAVVNTSGNYCIYQNGSGFYVGPYPEA